MIRRALGFTEWKFTFDKAKWQDGDILPIP